MMSGPGKKQTKTLSLNEVISDVLESDNEELSDIVESESEIRDYEDDEGRQ